MRNTLPLRTLVGIGSAVVFFGATLTLGTSANADPLGDLLCHTGSAQLCPPSQPAPPPLPAPEPAPRPPHAQPQPLPAPPQAAPAPTPPSVYYKNCTEVRRAGQAPLYRGEPGYARHLDRDNDGIACE
ncbi:excalibur calcium-binding domain-containing protein [Nocardia callitridis]|uniref:Excalibur calcium-binding domain-containing protein n=1 Tax=Nocardia callitridis TaxID=648753 RepID=A0ABP9JXM8_9NOCA